MFSSSADDEDNEASLSIIRNTRFQRGSLTRGRVVVTKEEMSHAHVHDGVVTQPSGRLVELTDLAIERFRAVMAQEKLGPDHGVRIAVASGGCSGMSYSMSFESQARPDDRVLEQDGLKLFIDAESAPYLDGVTIDYVVGLHREGFKFVNPKAARTCGCGESFGV
jgi:iron-sulfur cluster assembly protein